MAITLNDDDIIHAKDDGTEKSMYDGEKHWAVELERHRTHQQIKQPIAAKKLKEVEVILSEYQPVISQYLHYWFLKR